MAIVFSISFGIVLAFAAWGADNGLAAARGENESGAESANHLADVGIKVAVYREMLRSPLKSAAAKREGAYFLESSPGERVHIEPFFRNWSPRVEVGTTNNVLITKTNVMDRLSGKESRLFFARVLSRTNNTAVAAGGWHTSPVAGASSTYQLAFDGTRWIVKSKKIAFVY
jgi:hypothetical protein